MMETIRAIIRLRRIDRALNHLGKAARLATRAGLDGKIVFVIERAMITVSVEAVRIGDEAKARSRGIAA